MENKRKIAIVGKRVSFEESEKEDLMYWANLPVKERLVIAAEGKKNMAAYSKR